MKMLLSLIRAIFLQRTQGADDRSPLGARQQHGSLGLYSMLCNTEHKHQR